MRIVSVIYTKIFENTEKIIEEAFAATNHEETVD
jgi:hypothetical protein